MNPHLLFVLFATAVAGGLAPIQKEDCRADVQFGMGERLGLTGMVDTGRARTTPPS
jgi:hypothetical protein